jgi:hypothetical protein
MSKSQVRSGRCLFQPRLLPGRQTEIDLLDHRKGRCFFQPRCGHLATTGNFAEKMLQVCRKMMLLHRVFGRPRHYVAHNLFVGTLQIGAIPQCSLVRSYQTGTIAPIFGTMAPWHQFAICRMVPICNVQVV